MSNRPRDLRDRQSFPAVSFGASAAGSRRGEQLTHHDGNRRIRPTRSCEAGLSSPLGRLFFDTEIGKTLRSYPPRVSLVAPVAQGARRSPTDRRRAER
jgi:hypothetical protein